MNIPHASGQAAHAAGLLGYATTDLLSERLCAALERAPWRGSTTGQYTTAHGGIVALGGARIYHHRHVAFVLHGRIDNLDAVARQVNAAPGDIGDSVASAYLAYGDEFARQLIGDFALVLLDQRRRTFLATRDWIGARPLFWGEHDGVTAFGSEVKQVLALLGRPFLPDQSLLELYERNDSMPLAATFAADVRAVLPSGQVLVSPDAPTRAWRCPVRFTPIEIAAPEAARETRRLLEQAVARRTVGATSLGALVSGGMDSTSVAATAAYLAEHRAGPTVRHAFTLAYPGTPECDETALARHVADRWHMQPVPVHVDPAMIVGGHSDEILLHDGPPFPTVGQSMIYAEAAARGTDVLLTGQGGDFPLEQRGKEIELAILRGEWRSALGWTALFARRRPRAVLRTWLRGSRNRVRGVRAEQTFEHRLEEYMGRCAFEQDERAAMRVGVRVEAPFADEELMRFLAGIPPGLRTDLRQRRTKAVLREAMEDRLPPEVRLRRAKPSFDPVLAAALDSDEYPIWPVVARAYIAAFRTLHGAGAREP